jgi:hypothetical protein
MPKSQKSRSLKNQQEKLLNSIPPLDKILRTTVSTYYLTCGKQNCYCHKGKRKHGPYYYLSAKEEGKMRMFLIPKELLKEARKGIKYYDRLWEDIYKLCKINRQLLWKKKRNKVII